MANNIKLIFVNRDKFKRAEDIFALFSKTRVTEGEMALKERHLELLTEAGIEVNNKNKEKCVESIYRRLGGLVRTIEQQAAHETKVKKNAKKNKIGAVQKSDDEDDVALDESASDDVDTDDEDDE